jgi:membrane protein
MVGVPEDAPAEEPPVEPGSDATPGLVRRLKATGEQRSIQAKHWLERRRTEAMPVDLAVQYYERDRDSFASVLGAAIALRLFLFIVPTVVVVMAVILLVAGHDSVRSIAEGSGLTGDLASQIDEVTRTTTTTTLTLLLGGLWLTLWAGRSLTKVLAACSAGAWRMPGRQSRATVRMAAAVTTLVFVVVVTAAVLNRIKQEQGIAVVTTSWVVAGVVYGVAWFLVSASLPRGTRDPGALLPGSLLMGASLAGLQWFMQYYLPHRLERSTQLAGGLGVAVATLGYMFLVGRLMASSFILNAVVYDRIGSLSDVVFSLPGIRALPRRFPRIARYFDLDRPGDD